MVSAAQMHANIKGETLTWLSANSNGAGVSPSLWEIPLALPTGNKVVFGGPTDTSEQRITFTQTSGAKQVVLPLTLKGLEYRVSSVGAISNVGGGTSTATLKGSSVNVVGAGISSLLIELDSTQSPFTHYRPILSNIDSSVWAQAFRDARAPSGRYQGLLPYTAVYDYYRGGIRIRNTIVSQLVVFIDYRGQELSSIEVEGTGEMTATYHYPSLVSGEAYYTIKANGYFTDGVLVGLIPPSGKPYFSLKSGEVSNTDEIKYSVTCVSGCSENRQIIIDGEPITNNSTKRTKIDATNVEQATAKLRVSFDRQPLVENDTYNGSFVLMFEAKI